MPKKQKLKTCVTCTKQKPETNKFWVPHPDTGNFLASCKACRTQQNTARKRGETPRWRPKKFAEPLKQIEPAERYLITYAQNATGINTSFLAALKTYAKKHKAQILVIAGRYKNPTSTWSQYAKAHDWWDAELQPYLLGGRHKIGPNLTVFGDISIQPTATDPLSGFEIFAGDTSAIFGHPKVALQPVATHKRMYPRVFASTGAITKPNYIKSKAGRKAEALHVFGATVVEKSGQWFFVRQVTAQSDGSFIDLESRYHSDGSVTPAGDAEILTLGDIHVDGTDHKKLNASLFAKDSMLSKLRPKHVTIHDVLDQRTRNHHDVWDPQKRIEKTLGFANDDLQAELDRAVDFIDSMPEGPEVHIIASNHDEALDRWLKTADIRNDPKNAKLFHSLWYDWIDDFEKTGTWCPAFELYYRQTSQVGRAKFVRRNQSLRIKGIENAFHGDKGINGAKGGGPLTYAKIGGKTNTAHTHVPSIRDGNFTAGMSCTPDQGYNFLPSSWLQADIVTYADGNRSLLFVIDGRWRLA